MKRAWVLLLVAVTVAGSAMGQTTRPADSETGKIMADLAAKTRNTVCLVEIPVADETGSGTITGVAICVKVEGDKATLITTAVDTNRVPVASITKDKVLVTVPGSDKKLTAEYVSTDPETNITFITVKDPYKWQPVRFADKPDLSVGKQVFSVGLMEPALGLEPYLGAAFVSARLRVPDPIIYVTGGTLTSFGSPVLTADGTAVGIILGQLPNTITVSSGSGQGSMNMTALRESSFFVPSDEMGAIINNPPPATKRRPWIGVLGFEQVDPRAGLEFPAVRVGDVAPATETLSSPAAKVGLKKNDIITAIDGLTIEKFPSPQLTVANFVRQLSRLPADGTRKVKLTVLRAKNPEVLELAVEPFPMMPVEAKKYKNTDLGMIVRDKVPLDAALDASTGDPKDKGVYVLGVGADTPAAKANLKGMPDIVLITTVAKKPVTNVKEFEAAVAGELAGGKKPIEMVIRKGGSTETITIRP